MSTALPALWLKSAAISGAWHFKVRAAKSPARQFDIYTFDMAARNRPRGAFVKDDPTDAHEERNMWSQIVTDIKRLRATHARAAEVAKLQVDLEAKMGKCE